MISVKEITYDNLYIQRTFDIQNAKKILILDSMLIGQKHK